MDATFENLLSTPMDSVEKPKPLPPGGFLFNVKGQEFGESSQKGTPFVKMLCTPMSPLEDVDTELLAQVNGWQKKELPLTFYLTEDSIFRLKDFLDHCGVSIAGRTFKEALPDVINQQFTGMIIHEQSTKNKTDIYDNHGSTAPAA